MDAFLNRLALCALGTSLLLPAAALADRDDIRRLAETRISLTDAIAVAEKSQGGKAFDASLEDDSSTPEYQVSVAVGDKVFEVNVDGVTGEIRKVREDRDD